MFTIISICILYESASNLKNKDQTRKNTHYSYGLKDYIILLYRNIKGTIETLLQHKIEMN